MRIAVLFAALVIPLAVALFVSPVGTRSRSAPTPPSAAPTADQGEAPQRLDLVAREYGYAGPSKVAAGRRVISLRNEGKALHHVQVVQLTDGKQVADILAALRADPHISRLPGWAVPIGGPSAALPGATIENEVSLSPGRHVVLCWIPTPAGEPHFMKGMMMPFEVVEAGQGSAPDAGETATVSLREYGFGFDPPNTPGRRMLRVENLGSQPHEFLLVRLRPGATVEQVAEWSAKGQVGEAPVAQWAGVAALAPGRSAQVTVDFEPGRYAVFCLSPDRTDGRAHLEHGMHRTFEIPRA